MGIKKGFSLIELVIVIGLLALLSLAISSVMLMSIVSSKRLQTMTRVKQAGNYALDQMETLLRNEKTVVSCDSTNNIIQIINFDGGTTSLMTESSDGTHQRIASNSGFYLTPSNDDVQAFRLTCDPSDDAPTLVNIVYDLQDISSTNQVDSPLIHFETSVNLRNE